MGWHRCRGDRNCAVVSIAAKLRKMVPVLNGPLSAAATYVRGILETRKAAGNARGSGGSAEHTGALSSSGLYIETVSDTDIAATLK